TEQETRLPRCPPYDVAEIQRDGPASLARSRVSCPLSIKSTGCGWCFLPKAGAKRRKQVLLGPRTHKKDRSIACINLGAVCPAARNARPSRCSSAAATRSYGTAALRGPAATDPDTPARSAASNRRPAAAPQLLGFIGAA